MKLIIDSNAKTVTILQSVSVRDLIQFLKTIVAFEDYTLIIKDKNEIQKTLH